MRTAMIVANLVLASTLVGQEITKPAPELTWTATFNFGDVPSDNLEELRDSVVLLEFVSVQQKTSKEELHKLDQMFRDLAERGLVVISVTSERPEAVKAWIEKYDVKRPVAVGFNKEYDVISVPYAFLIDKDGKLLWHNHPALLDRQLLDNALIGALPAIACTGLEDVQALRRSKDYGATYLKAQKVLQAGGLSARAEEQAKRWCQKYEKVVANATSAAAKADADQDLYQVWMLLDPIATFYQGVPGADAAKQRVDALLADKKAVREIDAGKSLAVAQRDEKEFDYDAAFEHYKETSKQFGNTHAGKAAAQRMKELEKGGMLGYDARCPYCKAAGRACPQHDPKNKKKR